MVKQKADTETSKEKKGKKKTIKVVKPKCHGGHSSVKFGWWKDTPQNFSCINHTAMFALPRPQTVQVKLGDNVTFVEIKMMTPRGWVVVHQGYTSGSVSLLMGQYRANCARKQDRQAISTISW